MLQNNLCRGESGGAAASVQQAQGPRPLSRSALEKIYRRYTRPEFVGQDPVGFLYEYPDVRDREIVGVIASSLAYGRVAQIRASVSRVLRAMPSPAAFLKRSSPSSLRRSFAGFAHRFTRGEELAAMLYCLKRALERYGSLERCFSSRVRAGDETVLPALEAFVERLTACAGAPRVTLLPSPARGSACKRLNLFLRWMARRDAVDPGGWDRVPASMLIVPLDTHMHRFALAHGLTRRRQADIRTALEVTAAFRRIAPSDPVRYDFALTRAGMMKETMGAPRRGGLCYTRAVRA